MRLLPAAWPSRPPPSPWRAGPSQLPNAKLLAAKSAVLALPPLRKISVFSRVRKFERPPPRAGGNDWQITPSVESASASTSASADASRRKGKAHGQSGAGVGSCHSWLWPAPAGRSQQGTRVRTSHPSGRVLSNLPPHFLSGGTIEATMPSGSCLLDIKPPCSLKSCWARGVATQQPILV
ncbi:PREDICTED: uncharacterized protein LOC106147203 isoform X2 [Chinchilla lanigera]|nr:PREDICTED: uncharacterized protein LOC106147203 isoform X2 [Chinchilla lanigera]